MNNYFRATAYYPKKDISFIVDTNGRFNQLWELSSYLIKKGCKVIDIVDTSMYEKGNFEEVDGNSNLFSVRAAQRGEPQIDKTNNTKITVNNLYYYSTRQYY